jgi:putative chitinase
MTPGIDQLLAAGIKRDVAERWLPHVQAALARFGIESERQVAAWLAQTAHESGGYTMLTENLNYSADTMAVVWPRRFAEMGPDGKPKKDAKGKSIPSKFALALHRKPEMIANVVYANRMANGPTESGDGWRYRGRGLKQLTGKDNYTRCGKGLGIDLVASPDLLLEPEGAALSAAWFWVTNKCGPIADADDFVGLTKKINGGTIGLEDRQRRYKAVLASLGY